MIFRYILVTILILFASYADVFLFRLGYIPGGSPATFLMPIFLVFLFLGYPLYELLENFKSKTFIFLVIIFLISLFYSFNSVISPSVVQEVIQMEFMSIVLFFGAFQVFKSADTKLLFYFAIISFLVLASSIWYDFFIGLPRTNLRLSEGLRKGGFGENANFSARGLMFLSVIVFYLLGKFKRTFLNFMIFVVASSTLLTLSRSGILGVGLLLFTGILFNWEDNIQFNPIRQTLSFFKIITVFTLLFFTLSFLAEVIRNEIPSYGRGAAGARLALLTGSGQSNAIEIKANSDLGRITLFSNFFEDFMDKPLGHGNGYSRDQRINHLNTHNQYLIYAVDYGIIGIVLYLVLLIRMFTGGLKNNKLFYIIFVILIVFQGIFTHNLFFERAVLLTVAFFEAMLLREKNELQLTREID